MPITAQLKEQITIIVEDGACQRVRVQKWVVVLPGTLERIDLLDELVEVDFGGERIGEHFRRVVEHRRRAFGELRLSKDGVMRPRSADPDAAADRLHGNVGGPTDGGTCAMKAEVIENDRVRSREKRQVRTCKASCCANSC